MIAAVIAASIACQVAAAIRALSLVRTTGRRTSWTLMAAAFLLMAVRRIVTFAHLDSTLSGALASELVALAVSVVLLSGIWNIGDFFLEIRDAGEEVRRREDLYRSLLRQSSDGIFFFDPEVLRVRDANIRFLSLLGYREDEIRGRTLLDLVDAPEESVRANVARVMEEGVARVGERPYRRADGSRLWVDVTASRVRTAEGSVVLVNVRDVTDQKRESALHALLHDLDRKVISGLPLDELLSFACRELVARTGASLACVCGPDSGKAPFARALAGPAAGVADELGPGLCPCVAGLRTPDADEGAVVLRDDLPPRVREAWEHVGLEEGASFPVTVGEGRAVLSVASRRPADLAPLLPVLARVADELSVAIHASLQREKVEVRTAALEAAANPVLILDAEGRVEWANRGFEALSGWAREEIAGVPGQELESAAQSPHYYAQLWQTIRSGKVWRGEHFARRKDGTSYPEFQTITPVLRPDGGIRAFISVKQDATVERRDERAGEKDPLTGLSRRAEAEGVTERLVSRARRGVPSALVILDVDHFNAVNDAAGRREGDNVLRSVARILEGELRPGDQLFHFGGDEFAVLLEGLSVRDAKSAAERLRSAVSEHRFEAGGRLLHLGLSAGLAAVDGRLDRDAVLAVADAALHAAKERGRGRLVVGDASLLSASALAHASTWAARVKDALRSDQFVLFLQPVLRFATGEVEHHEALVRMRDGPGALVPPGDFLPAAERFGLMPELDTWVLRRSIELLRDDPGLRLLMNVSGLSLTELGCLEEMEGILRASRLGPGRVSFEITETAAVRDVLSVRAWLRRLKDLGCRFALDDFGIGFSSFSTLQSLPVDYVKIDGSFIRSVERDASSRAIVQSIVSVSRALGKETVAEFVESEGLAAAVAQLGVDMGQGYHLGVPREAGRAAPSAPGRVGMFRQPNPGTPDGGTRGRAAT